MIRELTGAELEVLEHFVEEPGSYHIRGLSQETGVPYATARKALEELEDRQLLEKDEKAKMTFYEPSGEKFRKVKKILNMEKLQESGLVDQLEQELRPEAVVLFGSYLEGRDSQDSDIDIAVIGGRDREVETASYAEELGREISLRHVEDIGDESKEFKDTLANGLVLKGYLEIAR